MKQNFIKTSDKNTAQKLMNLGYELVSVDNGSIYTFLNNQDLLFERNSEKVVFSNNLIF